MADKRIFEEASFAVVGSHSTVREAKRPFVRNRWTQALAIRNLSFNGMAGISFSSSRRPD